VASEFNWQQEESVATCDYHGVRLEADVFGWSITLADGRVKRGVARVCSFSSQQTMLAANKHAAQGAAFREVHKRG
jgi:hypothetical protein